MFKAGLGQSRQLAMYWKPQRIIRLYPPQIRSFQSLTRQDLGLITTRTFPGVNNLSLLTHPLVKKSSGNSLFTPSRQNTRRLCRWNSPVLNRLQVKRTFTSRRGQGPFPEIRYFRIKPITLFLGTFFTVTLFLLLLPIIVHLLLPLTILTIIFFQFNKWRRGQFYHQLAKVLPRSEILIPYRTVNSLQYSFLSEKLSSMKDIMKNIPSFVQYENNTAKHKREAIEFIKFVETRIMESLATDESGIRSYLFSNINKFRWFQRLQDTPAFELKLDTVSFKTYGQRMGPGTQDIMLSIQYPLKLILINNDTSRVLNNQQIYLGTVTLTILDDSSSNHHGGINDSRNFHLLSELAQTDAECKLVISLIPVSSLTAPVPRQFIISTWGDSGRNYLKFHISKTTDGHTEYTIRR